MLVYICLQRAVMTALFMCQLPILSLICEDLMILFICKRFNILWRE